MSAYFAISLTAAKPCAPYREDRWGYVARHIAACTLLPEKRWKETGVGQSWAVYSSTNNDGENVRMATSRAAWPYALHDKEQQQRDKSWREQIWGYCQLELLYDPATWWGGGGRSGRQGGVFVEE